MNIKSLKVYNDSQVVVNQVLGDYVVKEPQLKRYWEKVRQMLPRFEYVDIQQIPRAENTTADALSKLATTGYNDLVNCNDTIVEVVPIRSTAISQVAEIHEDSIWITPIACYLQHGTLSADKALARKLERKSKSYSWVDGALYKRGYLTPWLKCIHPSNTHRIIEEMHEGICGAHQ